MELNRNAQLKESYKTIKESYKKESYIRVL